MHAYQMNTIQRTLKKLAFLLQLRIGTRRFNNKCWNEKQINILLSSLNCLTLFVNFGCIDIHCNGLILRLTERNSTVMASATSLLITLQLTYNKEYIMTDILFGSCSTGVERQGNIK